MRFNLIDRITELVPGERITGLKTLTMAEEYLADHFPSFPVMPGVLMLETMTQAGAWLVRATDDFAHSIVVLKEARNVKYGDFVQPGETLTVQAQVLDHAERLTELKASGRTSGGQAVSARLVLERYNLVEEDPERHDVDEDLKQTLRENFALIYRPQEVEAT